ncbi:receptor-type tyrosine-protein phosphatase epsilon-like [Haliotis rufescens]|uniref:receptor-type tyrosine-protein phosphatase epsilon-like n=1 Tax=Haliotis rufescens TaxID=6454 RepID=UPI00201EBB82|nr:receptor-type tyrosine-protein phosphatase epsilon-like [Haliotis rufescens]
MAVIPHWLFGVSSILFVSLAESNAYNGDNAAGMKFGIGILVLVLSVGIIAVCATFVTRDTIAWVRMKLISLKDAIIRTDDKNRVALSILPGDPFSTYINASYINVTPTERTMKDFWRMIWEKKCGKIVMITRLVEKGKDKCEQYWRVKRPFVIGGLTITFARRDTRSHYIIREFSVKERQTEESRIITQFHFVAWPDHSVPDVTSLLEFIWHVRKAPTCQDGPLLVHCSAGIGRSGTYITLDYHLDKIQTDDEVDIFDFVCKLRHQRKGMIQTKNQYILL